METKIVLGCLACSEPQPEGFNMVAQCEECQKMVWINQIIVDEKNRTNYSIWCNKCIAEAPKNGDFVTPITYEQLKEIEEKGIGIQNQPWSEFAHLEFDNEAEYFQNAKKTNDDMMRYLEAQLPAMCMAFMSKVKVFEETSVDLSVGCAIAAFVERLLLDRRERLGWEHVFDGFDKNQKTCIMGFVFGVRQAVKMWREKHPEIKNPEDLKMLECSEEEMQLWKEGLKHWADNLPNCFDWGEERKE